MRIIPLHRSYLISYTTLNLLALLSEPGPTPGRNPTLRQHESVRIPDFILRLTSQTIERLQKENFGLKMRIFYLEESLNSAVQDDALRDDLAQLAELKALLAEKKRHEEELADELRRLQQQVATLSYLPAASPSTTMTFSSVPPPATPIAAVGGAHHPAESPLPARKPVTDDKDSSVTAPVTPSHRTAPEVPSPMTPSRSNKGDDRHHSVVGTSSRHPALSMEPSVLPTSPSVPKQASQSHLSTTALNASSPLFSSSPYTAPPVNSHIAPASPAPTARLPVVEVPEVPEPRDISYLNSTVPVNALHSTQDAWVPLSVPNTPARAQSYSQLASFRRASHTEEDLHRPLSSFRDSIPNGVPNGVAHHSPLAASPAQSYAASVAAAELSQFPNLSLSQRLQAPPTPSRSLRPSLLSQHTASPLLNSQTPLTPPPVPARMPRTPYSPLYDHYQYASSSAPASYVSSALVNASLSAPHSTASTPSSSPRQHHSPPALSTYAPATPYPYSPHAPTVAAHSQPASHHSYPHTGIAQSPAPTAPSSFSPPHPVSSPSGYHHARQADTATSSPAVGSLRPSRPAPPPPSSPSAHPSSVNPELLRSTGFKDFRIEPEAQNNTSVTGLSHSQAPQTPSQRSEEAHNLLLYIERENQLQKEKLRRMEEDMLALEQLLRSQHLSSPPTHTPAPTPSAHASHTHHSLMNGHSQSTQRADSVPTLPANQRIGERSSVVSQVPASVLHSHANGHMPGGKLDDELQRAFSRSERLCAELRERCQQIERMQNNITQLDESLPAGKILPDLSFNDEIMNVSRVREQTRTLEEEIVAQIEQTKMRLARSQQVLEAEKKKFLSAS